MSYYDIDSILTDAQKLPCTFELEVPGLGVLEGNPGENIKAGTRIDLPLWLGEMLSIGVVGGARLGTSRLVTLDLPSALSERVMNAFKADPRTVDLRSLAPHFYSLSERILELFEEEEMVEVLSNTFKKRAAEIADHAHNPQGALGQGAEFLRGLDETERQLFRVAHDSAKQTRIWAGEAKKK
ncbi:GINS complex, Psf3 component [Aspergillus ellipticus CBS 707.79]|uniref:DNA replication complex GINS protein PSF3 n=1 Tax=Aspergillus ellipticus CBS 707.79 TaxID=1448320 RepID=A0A319DYG1_9EURO|nr:GINS complex, Psf3 component [Aspergillus ellipticus CBS 707.79]